MAQPKTNRSEKINLTISEHAKQALGRLAMRNTRSMSQQIEHMIREAEEGESHAQ